MDIGWLQPLPSWSTGENGINQTSSLELDDQQPVGVINGDDTMDPTAPAQSYSLTETLLISAALLIIIVGTIVGNILVCTAVCLVRRLRRPCNYLLVSLAVSDLCVALLVMPMALVYEVLGTWPFGARVCDTWVAFDVLSCTASILNLCMISVDRYWAITRPLDYGVKRTPARMCFCVALVWISSACISLPPLLVLGNEHGQEGDEQCQVCQEFGYQIYATLGSFYIPLGVMAAVYYQIFQAAKRIVDEEKKAQSHLLMTRAAAESTVMILHHPLPVTPLVLPVDPSLAGSNSSRSNSALVVRRHADRQRNAEQTRSSIDSRTSSWTNSNGRPTTWPDVCSVGKKKPPPPPTTTSIDQGKEEEEEEKQSLRQREDGPLSHPATSAGMSDVVVSGSAGQRHTSLDIPRCPRRRYSSSASTEIHDTSFEVSMNNIEGGGETNQQDRHDGPASHSPSAQQQTLLPSNNRNHRTSTGSSLAGHHLRDHQRTSRGSRVRLRFALNKERKASTTLGIIMSAFTLCWFPFFVLALARPFVSQPDLVIPRWLSSLFLWLGYANSFLNPVIYATTNKDFRLPFREILCLRCKSLNSVMREDFYQSQYGNEANKTALALAAAAAVASSSSSSGHKSHDANHLYHHHHHHHHHHQQQQRRLTNAEHRTLAVDDDDDDLTTRTGSAAAFL